LPLHDVYTRIPRDRRHRHVRQQYMYMLHSRLQCFLPDGPRWATFCVFRAHCGSPTWQLQCRVDRSSSSRRRRENGWPGSAHDCWEAARLSHRRPRGPRGPLEARLPRHPTTSPAAARLSSRSQRHDPHHQYRQH
jgi:hypothetical protein